jgi:DNA-binding NtrC family response regulator
MAKIKNTNKKGAGNGGQLEYPIVGRSRVAQNLIKQIKRLAKGKDDILIIGEAGVGKGAIGRNIHSEATEGSRSVPLTSINMAVIDERDLDVALFGSERGEDGHPSANRRGLIEMSAGGTVLIEEVEEASLRTQLKIVKLIKDRQVVREGSTEGKATDVRIIITTKDTPEDLAEKNRILEELADELTSFERIEVPPLRERPEDVPLLVEYFTQEACSELGMEEPVIDINAIDVLVRQRWKENIRELKSVIDRSILFSTSGMFTLPPELTDEKTEVVRMINNILTGQEFEINKSLDIIERGIVERALERFGFNQSKAAQFLGMTEQTLRYRLKRLGIVPSRQRGM